MRILHPRLHRRNVSATLALAALVMMPALLRAQVSTSITSVTPVEATAGQPLLVTASVPYPDAAGRLTILYRPLGETLFQRGEMDLRGNTAAFTIPAEHVIAPFLEYYIVIARRDGSLETYPITESADPLTTPPQRTERIVVREAAAADDQVVFLSPEPYAPLTMQDLLVSVSLLRADSTVLRRATQVFIDDVDLTAGAIISDELVVVVPENLGLDLIPGPHRVTIRLFAVDGTLIRSASLPFVIRPEGDGAFLAADQAPPFTYGVTAQAESRNERVSNVGTWYNRASVQLYGKTGSWRVKANAFVTSEEQPDRQPQNRFFAGIESPWLQAGYGDSYPQFPDLIMSGKRVRGLTGGIHLGFLNVDVASGSTVRGVEGQRIRSFPADSFSVEYARDPSAAYGQINSSTWGKYTYGTYGRDLLVVRPSFGSGQIFQWGFTFLKGKDDISSIRYGIRPQENAVVGSDLTAKIDGGNITLRAQGAFSAYNSDISSGSFTDAYIDTVYKNDASNVKSARDILKRIITVNENLRPLSLNKMATLAYDGGISFNYFSNVLKVDYLFRGSDYASFGQSFLRKDIQGLNVQDRLRLLSNRLFVTLGYEQLHDNTSSSRIATTEYTTVTTAVSYYSQNSLPSVTVGYSRFRENNGITANAANASSMIDDVTNRVFLQSSYDFVQWARNTVAMNWSLSDRRDSSPRDLQVRTMTLSASVNSRFAIPLQTFVDFSLNANTLPAGSGLPSQSLNYATLTLSGRYGFLADVLETSLSVSPSFGDYRRLVADAGIDWHALSAVVLSLQLALIGNGAGPTDSALSLRARYEL
jgi:hypothetical protein